VQAVTGEALEFELCPGLLETRFYAARGVPALAYGPGILAMSHGPARVREDQADDRVRGICALTALDMLGARS
jgi:succinyl-diaminopimelate desuccinylase